MSIDLLTVFSAGLLTFATPCVLPLVPIYLAALVGGDVRSLGASSRSRLLSRAALFSLGFVAVFTAMGIGASSLGSLVAEHRSALQLFGAALVLVFALKFLGVIQIPWLDRVARADEGRLRTRFGAVNALVMGIVFAAGWSPCVGPVLGSVLTYTASTTASPAAGALYLSLYGMGFALPLLAIAAFADVGLRALARIKPHLPRIERATGALLLIVVGLLVHDAASGWEATDRSAAAEATADQRAGTGLGAEQTALLAAADTNGSNATAAASPTEPLPLMVELYAESCPVCQRMKPLVDELMSQCDEKGVRVRTVDVSRPENRHFVEQYRVVGVPTFLFMDERGQEVARLVGAQTPDTLRQALSALRGEQCPGLGVLPTTPNEHTPTDDVTAATGEACDGSGASRALAQNAADDRTGDGPAAASCAPETL